MDRGLRTSQHVSMKIPDDIQTFRVSSLDTRGAGVVLHQKWCQKNVHPEGRFRCGSRELDC